MMGKKIKWNKQQDWDDENQETTHNIEFKKKDTLQQRSIIFGMLQKQKWVSTKNQTFPKIGKNGSQTIPDNH